MPAIASIRKVASTRSTLVLAAAIAGFAVVTTCCGQEAKQKPAEAAKLPAGAVVRLDASGVGDRFPPEQRNPPSVRGLAFSPDGRWLATRGEPANPKTTRTILIWDTHTGKLARTLTGHDVRMADVEFSRDGKYIVAGQPEHVAGLQVWEFQTGKKLSSFDGGRGRFQFLPDGRRVAVVAAFGPSDVVRVHDVVTGNEVQRFVIEQNYRFAFSSDGSRLLTVRTGGRSELNVVDIKDGTKTVLTGARNQPTVFAFSPDGRTVAAGSSHRVSRDKYEHTLLVWELATSTIVHSLTQKSGRILAMRFTPDGRFLATGSADRVVRVWELATGKLAHEFAGHRGPVSSLAFSRNGQQLASGSFDRTSIIWNMRNAQRSFLPREKVAGKVLDGLWNELASPTPATAYRAMGQIANADDAALEALKLRVVSVLIPAQFKRIQQLVRELEAPDSTTRHRAVRELRKLRKLAKPVLLKVMKTTNSAEVRYRLRKILEGTTDSPRFSIADVRRMLRVIHIAETVGGPEAKSMLEMIIKDFPAERVIREAKTALVRLKQRAAG